VKLTQDLVDPQQDDSSDPVTSSQTPSQEYISTTRSIYL